MWGEFRNRAHCEESFRTRFTEVACVDVVTAMESLLKVGRHRATAQFTTRVPALAREVGVAGITRRMADAFYASLHKLSPKDADQQTLKAQAWSLATDLAKTRFLMVEQRGSSVSTPLLVVVVFWLSINFLSFGLFANRNITVGITLFVCALSVAGAIFLILEMDRPFEGLIRISDAPLRQALTQMSQ